MKQYLLFSPGPTPIPPSVIAAMSQPIIHHRHGEFKELLKRVITKLQYTFQTSEDVFIIAGSGTAAMETAICNLFSVGDHVLVVNCGNFGKRWTDISNAFGLNVNEIEVEWGNAVEPEQIKSALLGNKKIKAVFITHCESSTGVTNDIKTISSILKLNSDALVIVDAISSLAGEELRMNEWGIDVVVSASQKGLMTPPGLSFISLSQRARGHLYKSDLPKYYLDLKKSVTASKNFLTPWTPATTLIVGLDAALDIVVREKLETIWERNKTYSSFIRDSCIQMGLQMFSKNPSNIITAVNAPEGINVSLLLKILKEDFGIVFAGGQGKLQNKIFRISNIGFISQNEIEIMVKDLREVCQKCAK
jgi:aspartate aminotransferase-like enzyme